MGDDALLFRPASELAARIRAGAISSEAVVAAHLRQIERFDSRLHAVATLERDAALAAARAADRALAAHAAPIGPLHGVPITIKDAFRVQGSRTTYGLPQYRGYRPAADCELARRIRGAGAIL